MSVNVKLEKSELRRRYLRRRREMDCALKRRRDEAIVRYAKNLISFRYAEYVLLYAATDDEINIDALALDALSRNKKILFPRCNTENCTMEYHFVDSLDCLHRDAYGIREPAADAPVYDPAVHTGSAVCFVPGLVFDTGGFRVGYGKGYFDRYLSSFSGSRIGVVYEDFIVERVPRGRFDIKVDILLTEKNVKVTCEN